MNDSPEPRFRRPLLAFLLFSALCILASLTASLVQSDFGRLSVTNLRFRTETGKLMRAKLLHPNDDSLRYPASCTSTDTRTTGKRATHTPSSSRAGFRGPRDRRARQGQFRQSRVSLGSRIRHHLRGKGRGCETTVPAHGRPGPDRNHGAQPGRRDGLYHRGF
jgi:hypothetical protein